MRVTVSPGIGLLMMALAALLTAVPCTAEDRLQRLQPDSRLLNRRVNCLFRDSRGFLWMGTRDGIMRYDGRLVKHYRTIGRGGLTDLNILTIAEDAAGNIWAGSEFGTSRIHPYSDSIKRYYAGTGSGKVPFAWCNHLYLDRQKRLWFSSEKGVALYHAEADSFSNTPVSVYGADPKINKFVHRMLHDSRNRFWLATSYGVKLFDPSARTYRSLHRTEKNAALKVNWTYSLFEDSQSQIWAGTYEGGLLKFNERLQQFESVNLPWNNRGQPPAITAITEWSDDNGSTLLLATSEGLFSLTPGQRLKKWTTVPDDFLHCMAGGPSGLLWLGGQQSLYILSSGSPAHRFVQAGVSAETKVFHLIPDVSNPSRRLFLTQQEGWSSLGLPSGLVEPAPLPANALNMLGNVNHWLAEASGYWISSQTGFGFYDLNKRRFQNLTPIILKASGQAATGQLAKDGQGRIWVVMRRSGILVYDPATGSSRVLFDKASDPHGIYGYPVSALIFGGQGYMYFSGRGHIYRVNTATLTYDFLPVPDNPEPVKTNDIHLCISPGGALYANSSLQIWTYEKDMPVVVYPQSGYSTIPLEKIIASPDGRFGVITGQGIYITDSLLNTWTGISDLTGRPADDINELYLAGDSLYVMAGTGGVHLIRKNLAEATLRPPQVIIGRMKHGHTELAIPKTLTEAVQVDYKSPVDIQLSAPSLIDYPNHILQYRLAGWTNSWQTLENDHTVRFGQLPPGNYLFESRLLSSAGIGSIPATLRFTVVPPFYLNPWLIACCIILLLGLMYAFYRYRLQQAVNMEKLQTRIATDLHDDIGATLSSISMYSDVIKNQVREKLPLLEPVLQKMGDNSRQMAASLSDIVWDIHPANQQAAKLLERMENNARDMCALRQVGFSFEASGVSHQLKFSLEQRRNIYLIYKEALNNALKYAGCSAIGISVQEQQGSWILTISDNGRGFDTRRESTGNGIRNMETRAAQIGGRLLLQSGPGKGTVIRLQFPMR